MGDVTERAHYASTANLSARVALHQYATNPGWIDWLFARETSEARTDARILDVGCGMAGFWRANQERIGPGWALTLTDSSEAMVDAARNALGGRAVYAVADVQELPYESDTFDVVLANHMLYHVPDRPRAFAEIKRVLVPGCDPKQSRTCFSASGCRWANRSQTAGGREDTGGLERGEALRRERNAALADAVRLQSSAVLRVRVMRWAGRRSSLTAWRRAR